MSENSIVSGMTYSRFVPWLMIRERIKKRSIHSGWNFWFYPISCGRMTSSCLKNEKAHASWRKTPWNGKDARQAKCSCLWTTCLQRFGRTDSGYQYYYQGRCSGVPLKPLSSHLKSWTTDDVRINVIHICRWCSERDERYASVHLQHLMSLALMCADKAYQQLRETEEIDIHLYHSCIYDAIEDVRRKPAGRDAGTGICRKSYWECRSPWSLQRYPIMAWLPVPYMSLTVKYPEMMSSGSFVMASLCLKVKSSQDALDEMLKKVASRYGMWYRYW